MTKFIFKSNASDLQKISQSIETLKKNVLYLTYTCDGIHQKVKEMYTNKALQKQVDDYFEDTPQEDDKIGEAPDSD